MKMLILQQGPRHWVWRYSKATDIHLGSTWNKPQLGNLLLWLRFTLFLQPFQVDVRTVPSNRSWLLLAKSLNLVSNSYPFKGMTFLHVKITRQLHITRKRNHPTLQMYNNMWAHERGHVLELYPLTELQQCSPAIFEAPHDGCIGRNM
jgi:hypothetical protein